MTTKITTDNIASTTLDVISGVKVSAIVYSGNDTATDTAGGQTITLNGAGFKATPSVIINGVSASIVTFVSSTQITFTAPANVAGTYVIYVVNPDGATAIVVPGISYSGTPTWSTSAGSLGTVYETTAISNTVTATGDAPITYSLQSGTLPTNASLNSANGLISGTSVATGSPTTYTFTIRASDAQNQDTDRQFSLTINPDVVTWSSPANNATLNANVNTILSNVTMSATSAAGYGVTYTADTLPTGLSISGSNITGTPTVVANTTTTLTATAATTNRTATRTINWVISVSNDTYWNYTTTLLNAETVTSNVWIDDVSTNKFAITVNGDTRPTAFSPYETVWSNYFDGSGDYLTLPSNSAFAFGTADFTIEGWVYILANGDVGVFQQGTSSFPASTTNTVALGLNNSGTTWQMYAKNTQSVSSATYSRNVWYHFAVVRSGTTTTFYLNGTSAITVTGDSTNYTGTFFGIGSIYGAASNINAYISNLRVVKGTAIYTANFTPSTIPLTAIANTSLLTCQSNRLIDASTNNFTITKNGDVIVSNFGPFVETDVTTGSGYFDGTGDYLTIPANAAFNFGTGDFTIECFYYRSGIKGNSFHDNIIGNRPTSLSSGQWHLYVGPSAGGAFALQARTPAGDITVSGGTCIENAWNHLVVVKNGTTLSLFVNGVSVNSVTTSTSFGDSVSNLGIAAFNDGAFPTIGYISSVRIVKGTAVYTANFTPPASPLTAITNTSLLTLQYRTGENNNRFVDTSGLNSLITYSGNATQGTFSPYSLTGWSGYFTGSATSYIQTAATSVCNQGQTYTVQCWIYPTSFTTSTSAVRRMYIFVKGVIYAGLSIHSDGTLGWYGWPTPGGIILSSSAGTITTNVWQHVALVVNPASYIKLFKNGVEVATSSYTAAGANDNAITIGHGDTGQGTDGFIGYISNFKVTPSALTSGQLDYAATPTVSSPTNSSLMVLQSNRFVDNGPNALAITVGAASSVQSFSPFGSRLVTPTSYSGYFDGTGDYLTYTYGSELAFGTGNFTVEFWMNSTSTNLGILQGDTGAGWGIAIVSGTFYWQSVVNVANLLTASVSAYLTNTWRHWALVRSSGTLSLYIDGQLITSVTDNTNYSDTAGTFNIGYYPIIGSYVSGYLSNLRIVKGTAVYISTFTPPTSPLTSIANTSLLTCQSSTFIDNSTNNFTITANGDAAARSFNPFGNTVTSDVEYSVTTVGGSMYFDGTTDYITVANSIGIKFGTTPFTIEFWMYRSSSASAAGALLAMNGAAYGNWSIVMTGGAMYFQDYYATNSLNNYFTTDTSGIPPFTWAHVAYVRVTGGSSRFYVNGKPVGTAVTDTRDYAGTGSLLVGGVASAGYGSFNGYLSNIRIVKGSSLYTSSFNPPVSLMQSISGTTLMLNGTNGGIIDYTGKNNLETVGDARTSTAVVKYGSRSLYFDGTTDVVRSPTSPNLDFGAGSFTVEFWMYANNFSGSPAIVAIGSDATGLVTRIFESKWYNYWVGAGDIFGTYNAAAVATATWLHIAWTRNGTSMKFFVNGNQVGNTVTSSANHTSAGGLGVGGPGTQGTAFGTFSGYIDDVRVTKGYARYTANFTAPTGAFITK